jgi:hypothetical protein
LIQHTVVPNKRVKGVDLFVREIRFGHGCHQLEWFKASLPSLALFNKYCCEYSSED